MGRTKPSYGGPPPGFLRDARAKKAKATVNRVIPALLVSNARARRGVEAAELIVDPPQPACGNNGGSDAELSIKLAVADTLSAAHSLLKLDLSNREARVAILNMASPLGAGGGFLNGATSQEESLCMRTTLLPSLRDEFYRLPELSAVHTPDVLVFRDQGGRDLDKKDRWFVDCLSASMLRLPETDIDDNTGQLRYSSGRDRELVLQKMRLVLGICQSRGIKKVVLGAWGCGAYGNPVEEVAEAWRKVLMSKRKPAARKDAPGNGGRDIRKWSGIEEVVFAIQGASMAERFQKAFGPGLERQEITSEHSGDGFSSEEEDEDEEDDLIEQCS